MHGEIHIDRWCFMIYIHCKEMNMADEKPSCSICAYRATCNKKYSITDPSKCLDYARDLRIPVSEEDKKDEKEHTKR